MLVGMKPAAPASKAAQTSLGSSRSENMTSGARGMDLRVLFDQGLLLRIFNRGAAKAENDHRTTSGLMHFQLG